MQTEKITTDTSVIVAPYGATGLVLVMDPKYSDSRLKFPGGSVEPGETPEEGALRELEEETGITASIEDLVFQFAEERDTTHPHTRLFFSLDFGHASVWDMGMKNHTRGEVTKTGEIPYLIPHITPFHEIPMLGNHRDLLLYLVQRNNPNVSN